MNKGYLALALVLGGIIGITLVILIIKICTRDKSGKPEYDERQFIARLKSFRAGFVAMVITSALLAVLAIAEIKLPVIEASKYFIPVLVGIIALVSCGIWTDGYWGINFNKTRFLIIMTVLSIFNLALPIVVWSQDGFFNEDSLVDIPLLEFMAGIMFFVLLIQSLLKDYIDRKIENEMSKEDDE